MTKYKANNRVINRFGNKYVPDAEGNITAEKVVKIVDEKETTIATKAEVEKLFEAYGLKKVA